MPLHTLFCSSVDPNYLPHNQLLARNLFCYRIQHLLRVVLLDTVLKIGFRLVRMLKVEIFVICLRWNFRKFRVVFDGLEIHDLNMTLRNSSWSNVFGPLPAFSRLTDEIWALPVSLPQNYWFLVTKTSLRGNLSRCPWSRSPVWLVRFFDVVSSPSGHPCICLDRCRNNLFVNLDSGPGQGPKDNCQLSACWRRHLLGKFWQLNFPATWPKSQERSGIVALAPWL